MGLTQNDFYCIKIIVGIAQEGTCDLQHYDERMNLLTFRSKKVCESFFRKYHPETVKFRGDCLFFFVVFLLGVYIPYTGFAEFRIVYAVYSLNSREH